MPVTPSILAHDTIRLERIYSHSAARVFRAYADVDERARWSAPSDDEYVSFDEHDFRVGGVDRFTCGRRSDPTASGTTFSGTTRYESIVDDDHVVFTERLVTADHELLAMSLVTWAVEPVDDGCRLTIVDQVTSFAGDGPIEGSRHGYRAMLDQLQRHLAGALPVTEEIRR